jgi:hypothetical protein
MSVPSETHSVYSSHQQAGGISAAPRRMARHDTLPAAGGRITFGVVFSMESPDGDRGLLMDM